MSRLIRIEWFAIFVALPFALAWMKLRGGYAVPIIPTLVGLSAFIGLVLVLDPSFRWRDEMAWRWEPALMRPLLLRFLLSAALMAVAVALILPEKFLSFPRERPALWLLVMVLYPLLSVVPQEFLYRTVYFHRYGSTLGGPRGLVVSSALLFGWTHLLFGNLLAIGMTAVGGLFFAGTFSRTRSLWMASFEHALYGQLVFTVGLGEYFYGGTIQAVSR